MSRYLFTGSPIRITLNFFVCFQTVSGKNGHDCLVFIKFAAVGSQPGKNRRRCRFDIIALLIEASEPAGHVVFRHRDKVAVRVPDSLNDLRPSNGLSDSNAFCQRRFFFNI